MEFKRYDGYVNHIPQEFIDYHLPVCPFCRSNTPHWLLAQKADLTISGGRNYYRCDCCGATLSSTILDAASEKGKAFAINPTAAALHAIHKGRSRQGVTVPYLRVEELGGVCQQSDWLGKEEPVTYFQELAKGGSLTPISEEVNAPIPENDTLKDCASSEFSNEVTENEDCASFNCSEQNYKDQEANRTEDTKSEEPAENKRNTFGILSIIFGAVGIFFAAVAYPVNFLFLPPAIVFTILGLVKIKRGIAPAIVGAIVTQLSLIVSLVVASIN